MNPTTNTEARAVADVAAIARGLTKAQRLVFVADGGSKRAINRLMGMGLVAGITYHSDFAIIRKWSRLGIAVRQHLEQGATAGEVASGAADHTITAKGAQP